MPKNNLYFLYSKGLDLLFALKGGFNLSAFRSDRRFTAFIGADARVERRADGRLAVIG